MKNALVNRSIHISGSCSPKSDKGAVIFSHLVVKNVTKWILENEGNIVTSVGKNPTIDGKSDSSSIIFDWDVLDVIYDFAKNLGFSKDTKNVAKVIATSKSFSKIPKDKENMWQELIKNGVVSILRIPYGWNSGAVRRRVIESQSDALISIGGGEGVEHIAELFSLSNKPVIPLNMPVGSSCNDGKGGSLFLSNEFLSKPKKFVPNINDEIAAKYTLLDYNNCNGDPEKYTSILADFLCEVIKPQVFFVRLLNKEDTCCEKVNNFFKEIIVPFVKDKNLSIKDMKISKIEEGFLNVEIIKNINKSKFVVVDLTSLRPNCLFEMGYAFGLNKKVIVTAINGTKLPFDTNSIPCFFWNPEEINSDLKNEFEEFWNKKINRRPLVPEEGII